MRAAAASIAAVLLLLLVGPLAAATAHEHHSNSRDQPQRSVEVQQTNSWAPGVRVWQHARKLLQSTATGMLQPPPTTTTTTTSSSSAGTWPWPWPPGSLLLPAALSSGTGNVVVNSSSGGLGALAAWLPVVRWADHNSTPSLWDLTNGTHSSGDRAGANSSQHQPVLTTVSQAPPASLQPLPQLPESAIGTLQDPSVRNLLLVAVPVVAVIIFLCLMVCCLHLVVRRACPHLLDCLESGRSNPSLTTPYDYPLVQPVDVETGALSAGRSNPSGARQGGTRVRSMQDVLQMWQRHVQADGQMAVRTVGSAPAQYRHTWEMHGDAGAPGGSSSAPQRLRSNTSERGWVHGLFRSSTHPPGSLRGQSQSQTSAAEQDRYARLAPDTADLRDSYLSACRAYNRINQGDAAVREGPLRERLRVLRLQLFLRVQALQQQLAGRVIVTWGDVELARDIWEAAEDPISGIPAAINRPKRFPGLAPWLIAELPTWVHTPHPAAGEPPAAAALAAAAGAAVLLSSPVHIAFGSGLAGAGGKVADGDATAPSTSNSSSSSSRVQQPTQHPLQRAPDDCHKRTSSTHSITSVSSDTSSSHDSSQGPSLRYSSHSSGNMEADAAVAVLPASHKPDQGVTRTVSGVPSVPLSRTSSQSGVQQQQQQDEPVGRQRLSDQQLTWEEDHEADSSCAVCLDPLEAGDLLQQLPPCGHTFHAPCLAEWLANSATCPVCRAVVLIN